MSIQDRDYMRQASSSPRRSRPLLLALGVAVGITAVVVAITQTRTGTEAFIEKAVTPTPIKHEKTAQEIAQEHAQVEFERHWLRQGEVWYTYHGRDLYMISGLKLESKEYPLTEADRLNGVQWQVFVFFHASAMRYHEPDSGWSDWKDINLASGMLSLRSPTGRLGFICKNGDVQPWEPTWLGNNPPNGRKPNASEILK